MQWSLALTAAVTAAGTTQMPKSCVNVIAAKVKARLTRTPVVIVAARVRFPVHPAMEQVLYTKTTARPAVGQRKSPAGSVTAPEKSMMMTATASVDDVTALGRKAALSARKDV